ncbi:phosphorylase [Granulicella sp. 5B5]|uniref:phosphorylase family protein n=1 Tax=Granulicella sp. 5B5 TaxID=1617967 RepID=UPI0015F3B316|nr:phosphorylase [Granulicella sp. 5B5]QMV17404.1 phosphorylase [Granulicella sp. 5B5]
MPPSLAIIAALPREIALLVRGTKPDTQLLRRNIHLYTLPNVIVVAAGMGANRATLAVEAALAAAPIATLISTGLVGACTPALRPGDVAEAGLIIASNTGERFVTASPQSPTLVTAASIASIDEKRRLAATYNAAMVDMEAATVARLAAAHGLRLRAIKAVSDAYDFELAALSRFATPDGQFRTGAFALYTALRPHLWSTAAHLGRNSTLALKNLHTRLLEIIAAEPVS